MGVWSHQDYHQVAHNSELMLLVSCRCCVLYQVQGKRWKVDLNSRQEASLLLSAVNLPGGVQVGTAPAAQEYNFASLGSTAG